MLYIITRVTAESNHKLRLVYSDDSEIIVDLKPIIEQGGVFVPLSNPQFFSQVKLGKGSRYIEWDGGINVCAYTLWFEAHPNDNPLSLSANEYV
ncbi:MAG: DUF2442 domain-containing protein [Microcoleaceae cyanobacterium]